MIMTLRHIVLDYDFSLFLNANYHTHEGSCIKHQVYELTDVHKDYGGFPDSYSFENTRIHQLWWDDTQVDFQNLGNQLDMDVVTVSTILQSPGNVIPIHRDTFFQIKNKYPDDTRTKVRANIYLEDWAVGHLIQYKENSEWKNSTHWKAGEGWLWDSSILHLSANAGMQNKYTMQISGFLRE
jgi:hypothetical protein